MLHDVAVFTSVVSRHDLDCLVTGVSKKQLHRKIRFGDNGAEMVTRSPKRSVDAFQQGAADPLPTPLGEHGDEEEIDVPWCTWRSTTPGSAPVRYFFQCSEYPMSRRRGNLIYDESKGLLVKFRYRTAACLKCRQESLTGLMRDKCLIRDTH